jgi:hypothetical protein
MKKNLKTLTAALGLCVLLVGITTSVSSFTTAGIASSTSTSTTTGTQGSQPSNQDDAVLVSGIDCSTSQVVHDPISGAIIGYYKYIGSYTACLPGFSTCKVDLQSPCVNTDFSFIPK